MARKKSIAKVRVGKEIVRVRCWDMTKEAFKKILEEMRAKAGWLNVGGLELIDYNDEDEPSDEENDSDEEKDGLD